MQWMVQAEISVPNSPELWRIWDPDRVKNFLLCSLGPSVVWEDINSMSLWTHNLPESKLGNSCFKANRIFDPNLSISDVKEEYIKGLPHLKSCHSTAVTKTGHVIVVYRILFFSGARRRNYICWAHPGLHFKGCRKKTLHCIFFKYLAHYCKTEVSLF